MIEQLLKNLHQAGVKLRSSGGELTVDAPVGGFDPALVEQILEKKAAIVSYLATASAILPLTPKQQAIISAIQSDPATAAVFQHTRGVELYGSLDIANLQTALDKLVQQYDALRVRPLIDGARQQILHTLSTPFRFVDLSTLPKPEQEAEIATLTARETITPFEIHTDPLFRATLVSRSGIAYLLLLTVHQLIADRWSMDRLVHDLGLLYTAVCSNCEPHLAAATSFQKHVQRSEMYVKRQRYSEDQSFWLAQLARPLSPLTMPTGRDRAIRQSNNTFLYSQPLPAALTRQIKRVADAYGISFTVYLMAAYRLMLHRFSGQHDIAIDVPVAQRPISSARGIANRENILPIRQTFDPNTTFKWLLLQTAKAYAESVDHSYFPLDQIGEPVTGTPHLATVLFHHRAAQTLPDFGALKAIPAALPTAARLHDLSLTVIEKDDHVVLHCRANCDLYRPETIRRQLNAFVAILQASAADPYQKTGTVPLLDASQRDKLINRWNFTAEVYDTAATVAELFEAQVAKAPQKIALRYKEKTFTYAQLDQRANQLARLLRSRGVRRNQVVGICLDRKPALLIALLAIHKAGGAHLMLPAAASAEVMSHLLTDAQPYIVLTQRALQHKLRGCSAYQFVIDTAWQAIDNQTVDPVKSIASSQNYACVAYGIHSPDEKPRGVIMLHQNIVNLLTTLQKKPGIKPDDVLLTAVSLASPCAALGLLLPLVSGATLLLASAEQIQNDVLLRDAIDQCGVTLLHSTAEQWNNLVQSNWLPPASLTALVSSAPFSETAQRPLSTAKNTIWLLTGSLETTVWSLLWRVEPDSSLRLGRPLGNTQTYILDDYAQPVPIGVIGTLWIGGDGVAHGYLNRPNITARKFVPDPFGMGRTRFCTGIAARYLSDGTIVRR